MIPLIYTIILISQPIYEIEEIVVTATRYPIPLQNIAVATMVIDKEAFEFLHPLGIQEIFNASAGLDIKDYGTPGSVSSVSLRGIPSNGTLVLLNDQPLNTPSTGMADLSIINAQLLERIEIVKGPVASLYGANALGGVINIITTRWQDKPFISGHFIPSTTSFDSLGQTYSVAVKTGIPFARFQIQTSGAYDRSDGRRSNSDMEGYNVQGTVAYRAASISGHAYLTYSDKEYGIPGPVPFVDSVHPVPIFGDSSATSLFDRSTDRAFLGNVTVKWVPSEQFQWKNTLYGDQRTSNFHTQYAGWMGDTIIEDHEYLTYTIGFNSMVLMHKNELDLSLGLDVHYDTLQTTSISEQSIDTTWSAQSYTIGGWCQVMKDFSGKVRVVPSIRFDYNEDFGGFLSPGLGLISTLHPSLQFKASVGRTFRAPTFNDLYWPLSGNQDLVPENGWAYEVRVESSPTVSIHGAVSLFIRNVKDRIFWLPDTGTLWKPQNVNYLSISGYDVELYGTIQRIIDLSFEATYVSAIQKNDEIVYDFYDYMADTGLTIIQEIERDAAFVPRYTLRFQQHVHLPLIFNVDLNEIYISKRSNYYSNYDSFPLVRMDEKVLDNYMLLNAALSRDFSRFLSISMGIKNLLDIDYALQFGYSVDDLDYPMPGRTYFLSVHAHY